MLINSPSGLSTRGRESLQRGRYRPVSQIFCSQFKYLFCDRNRFLFLSLAVMRFVGILIACLNNLGCKPLSQNHLRIMLGCVYPISQLSSPPVTNYYFMFVRINQIALGGFIVDGIQYKIIGKSNNTMVTGQVTFIRQTVLQQDNELSRLINLECDI